MKGGPHVSRETSVGGPPRPLTPQAFQAAAAVDDEVVARLRLYADTLRKWQRHINLVGPGTMPDLWRRHMLDSAQLLPLLPPGASGLADLGSGAGFPGLVLAIMGVAEVFLVESDQRKAAFLSEVNRLTGAGARIVIARAETVALPPVDVVTARGLAGLPRLLDLVEPFIERNPKTTCLFLKGKKLHQELTETQKNWIMQATEHQSCTDPSGTILRLEGLRRAGG